MFSMIIYKVRQILKLAFNTHTFYNSYYHHHTTTSTAATTESSADEHVHCIDYMELVFTNMYNNNSRIDITDESNSLLFSSQYYPCLLVKLQNVHLGLWIFFPNFLSGLG